MAVAVAPCEERDGHGRTVGPSLSGGTAGFSAAVLCRCFLYYSRRPRSVLRPLGLRKDLL